MYNTEKCTQYFAVNYKETESEKNVCVCVYIYIYI